MTQQQRQEQKKKNRKTTHDDELQRHPLEVEDREDQADSGPDRDNPITVRGAVERRRGGPREIRSMKFS